MLNTAAAEDIIFTDAIIIFITLQSLSFATA